MSGIRCFLLFAVFIGLAACTPPDTREADIAAIRDADLAWAKAQETNGLEGAMSFYVDDAIMLPPNEPMAIGKDAIDVTIWHGTKRDAILYSTTANSTHGLARSNGDKLRAVSILLNDPEWGRWSDREIARHCAVSQPFVGKVRSSEPRFPGCRLPKATLLRSSTPGKAERAGTWVGASREVAQTQLFGAAPRIWRALSSSRVDHGRTSPAGLSSFIAPDPHAGSGGGCGLSPSIRRRMSANSARGTATSASWNTT
jgi:hypothetical protein